MGVRTFDGPLILEGLTDVLGVPLGQLNFFVGCIISLFVAILYRKWLAVPTASSMTRHSFSIVMGVMIAFFVVGRDIWLLLLKTILGYTLMLLVPAASVHIVLFVFSFGFLFLCHVYLMLYPFEMPTLDITYGLMISTQKLTSLGFSLADWHRYGDNPEKLSEQQRALAVRKLPSLLEFCSYMLGFQSAMIGPFYHYNDFVSFVEGSHYSQQLTAAGAGSNANYKLDSQRVPSPNKAVLSKLVQCIFWIGVHMTIHPLMPVENNADPSFIHAHGLLFRILYCSVSLCCYRSRYYFGWTMADAVNNAAGFGFTAFDEKGEAKWDMLTNCYFHRIEMATSFKTYLDNWNLSSLHWLRFVCYIRSPWNPTLMTFVLSALWHGFWPGYYVMFLSGALFTFAARKWRRNVRPYFQTSRAKQVSYDVFTWMATQMSIAYITVPFVILQANPILTFYNHWYWSLHIIAVCIILFLPSGRASEAPRKHRLPTNNDTAKPSVGSTMNDVATNHAKSKDL